MAIGNLPQRQRILALLVNFTLALIVHHTISGHWTVTGDTADAWLIAFFAFWLIALVSAPFFTPPKDSFANAIGALIALLSIGLTVNPAAGILLLAVRGVGLFLCVTVVMLAIVAIAAHSNHRESPASRFAYRLSSELGRGEVVFTPVVLVSAFGGYANDTPALLSIVAIWSLTITVGLAEFLLRARTEFWPRDARAHVETYLGSVQRFDNPGLVRVLLTGSTKWDLGTTCVLELPNRDQVIVLPVFEHPGVEGRIGTGLIARGVPDYVPNIRELEVHTYAGSVERGELLAELSGAPSTGALAGILVEGSSIGTLRFEALDQSLAKGQMIHVCTNGKLVFYQIVEAQTSEEALSSQLWGRRVATAIQLGEYVPNLGFIRYDWVPLMNSCVFRVCEEKSFPYAPSESQFEVGVVPGTQCRVFADVDLLVHYHAAILGVTGTGKTELSLDVVRGAVARGCKVVCVDFTGEYAKRLADLKPLQLGLRADLGKRYEDALFAVETGAYGAGAEKAALKKFVDEIGPLISKQVDDYISGEAQLAVLELAEITNTKASLRTTELFLSAFMSWARRNRRKKKILLVLEEAHTIVPETGGSGMDYESRWVVDRIGQIALQGRKYGIGLLVVSQRTALVSKTILSQCNSFFVFSLVDQTSLNFLASVLSAEHVAGITNLKTLEMICYGRAISSERPLLVQRIFDERKGAEAALLDA